MPNKDAASAVASPVGFNKAAGVRIVTEETSVCFGADGQRFVLQELLGSGSFGSVYRCSLESAGGKGDADQPVEYAVKVIDANRLATITGYPLQLICPRLQREVEILQLFDRHPHILRLHFAFFSEATSKFYLVTEFVNGGDMFSYIVRQGRPFAEEEGRQIFLQIVDAVGFCHRQGVAHRDLKLENILLDTSGGRIDVKVCDYGQAKVLTHEGFSDTAQTLTTTPAYTAPEVKHAVEVAAPYDAFKADAYGLGVVLFGMLCNALPDAARGHGLDKQRKWNTLSEAVRDLIQALLNADPVKRLAVKDIEQHQWLRTTPISLVPTPSGNSFIKAEPPSIEVSLSILKPELDAVLTTQELVAAVQRERGAACWALNSAEGEAQLHWRMKFTEERFADAATSTTELCKNTEAKKACWTKFNGALQEVIETAGQLRQKAAKLIKQRDETLSQEEDFWEVFDGYTSVISHMLGAMTSLVASLVGEATPSSRQVRFRWLQCSAEQLGRERAFLCGHLERPETLRLSAVVMELSKIIGARQLLLGTTKQGQRDTVVSSEVGLLGVVGLAGTPIVDLTALECAEDQVLKARRGSVPAAAETYHLTTEIIDKIHQHILVLIVELFSLSLSSQTSGTGPT